MLDAPLPSISVVMPSFNSEQFIRQAIDSVLNQRYPRLELLVMDGGSNDGTVNILKEYGNSIRWVSRKDRGQSDAINQGLKAACGEIVAWLNSDDLYEPSSLHIVGRHFAGHPDSLWAFGFCSVIDEKGNEIRNFVSRYKEFRMRRYTFSAHLTENFIPQMGVFFRKKALSLTGYLDETLYWAMDYDLWLRLGKISRPNLIDVRIAKFRMYPATKSVSGFRKGFREDLSVATRYAENDFRILFLHRFHNAKIVLIYSMISFFSSITRSLKKITASSLLLKFTSLLHRNKEPL